MIQLYHTSNVEVCTPDVLHSREHLDFGRGFYLTSLREQAEKYGQRFLRKGETAVMNVYELDDENLQEFSRIIFKAYDSKCSTMSPRAAKGKTARYTISLKEVLPMTKCLTPSTSISQGYTLMSKHLINCDLSIPTIRYALLINWYSTNISIL